VEDPALVTGAARFTEDIESGPALHAAFVRSSLPHATIVGIDAAEAARMAGVIGVFSAADLPDLAPRHDIAEIPEAMDRPPLARDRVRFAGEPVVVVVAESRAEALDAAEAVFVDLDPLPTLADPLRALDPDAPVLFPEHGSNLAVRLAGPGQLEQVDAFAEPETDALAEAEVVVRGRFVNQRLAPVPMEPNGILAVPESAGGVTVWCGSQSVFTHRKAIAHALGLPKGAVRVVSPAVGGGFGAKFDAYPEQIVVAALALRLGRPVRFVESRSENLLAMTHGRAQIQDVELGATRDGRITGLRAHVLVDGGAYPGEGAVMPWATGLMASGAYRTPRIDFRATAVATNTTPTAAYRGAGRPEASALIERAVDLLAGELRMDPAEIRRLNFVRPEDFPYRTQGGARYDTGDYGAALDRALEMAGYENLRREQRARRERGDHRLLGIGLSSYVEVTAWDSEFGSVEVHPDGTVTVTSGLGPTGQGHETALVQLAAGVLGMEMEAVRVVLSDTRVVPRGHGTGGSRSLQVGGSAVFRGGEAVLEKARRIAAHLLEASPDDVQLFADGRIGVAGAPDTAIGWGELADAAADPSRLPEGMKPGLSSRVDFEMEGNTFPFGTHVSVVEVDTETGEVLPLRHVAVDDCGVILNPMMVDGQVHGGVAQGLAQALFEEFVYDEDANPLTGSLMAYEMPSAPELPMVEIAHTETTTGLNPLGAKGIGEAATVGSTPAVQNAVIDALSHLGVRHIDMPLTPERVWRAIQGA
jgi:aerobic carbon-monoxide dehydrogenase large subunit